MGDVAEEEGMVMTEWLHDNITALSVSILVACFVSYLVDLLINGD